MESRQILSRNNSVLHRPHLTPLSELFNIGSQFRPTITWILLANTRSRHFTLLFSTGQWFLTRVAKWTTWIHRVHNSTPIKAIYSSTNIYHLNYCTFRELNGTASPCYLCSPLQLQYLHDVIAFTYHSNQLLCATVRRAFPLTFATG